jgi:hypothetical protein
MDAAVSNTLIDPKMTLGRAMAMVQAATPPDGASFQITARFQQETGDMLKSMDEFSADTLQPAIEAALADKQPRCSALVDREPPANADKVEFAEIRRGADGMFGWLVRYYDTVEDKSFTRIDIRVLGANVTDTP